MKAPPDGYQDHWLGDMLWTRADVQVWCGFWTHQSPYAAHDHDFLELVVVMDGRATQVSVLGRTALRKGNVVLLRPGTWHAYEETRDFSIWNCCFGVPLLRHELLWTRQDPILAPMLWGVSPGQDARGVTILRIPNRELDGMRDLFQTLRRQIQGSASGNTAEKVGLLLQVLGVVSRHTEPTPGVSSSPRVVHQLAEALQENPGNDWTLEALSHLCKLDKSYLSRLFRASMGVSPMAYLNRLRAEQAATLVRNTDTPLSEIAERVGWPEPALFARNFKRHFGKSARDYRNQFRK